jgi:hypothetical protein
MATTIRMSRWIREDVEVFPRRTFTVTTFRSSGLIRPMAEVTRIRTATKMTFLL